MIVPKQNSPAVQRPLDPERRTVIRDDRRSELFGGWGVRF